MTSASELLILFATIVLIVGPLLLASVILLIPTHRIKAIREDFRSRFRKALPFVSLLAIVLIINGQLRDTAEDFSLWLGIEITHHIVGIEGHTVARIQDLLGGEGPLIYFSFMYIYGYIFLLVFPLIAYYFLEDLSDFKSLTLAYVVNYGVGFILYTMFVAFGPRNMIPEIVGQPLYTYNSQLQILTGSFNEFTNVFPSLHTSLSATVMLFAWHTRREYKGWMPIAMFIGTSVMISTMYLAIHWVTDVVIGLLLAAVSYWIGITVVRRNWIPTAPLARFYSSADDEGG